MSAQPILFSKAQNPGYTRKDGVYVKPFNDRRAGSKKPPAKRGVSQGGLFGSPAKKPPAGAKAHPKLNEKGQKQIIDYPSMATAAETWGDSQSVAVFTPGGSAPQELHGVDMHPWSDVPAGDDWDFVDGQNDDLVEPPITLTAGKKPASGVIVQEPDGRVWIISPTNQFAGVMNTFPKGGVDEGLSYQSNAIKEAYEECGLKVEIDAHALDVVRSTSVARYYLAHRVGGTPVDMGWESQAVRLVPLAQLGEFLNRPEDQEILDFLRKRAEQP